MIKENILFWDVDTQYDFMYPDGALYVKGAETIVDTVSKIRRQALKKGYSIIATSDWHSKENPEISDSPDYEQTFPPHCIAGSKGARRVGELGDLPIQPINIESLSEEKIKEATGKKQFHLELRKIEFNVFSSPNAIKFLDILKPEIIYVFGVALDICVYYEVNSLAEWGKSKIVLLKDAVKGLDIIPEQKVLEEFAAKGVEITTSDKLDFLVNE
jgi:nicotinamidase/pyrazinamidase